MLRVAHGEEFGKAAQERCVSQSLGAAKRGEPLEVCAQSRALIPGPKVWVEMRVDAGDGHVAEDICGLTSQRVTQERTEQTAAVRFHGYFPTAARREHGDAFA